MDQFTRDDAAEMGHAFSRRTFLQHTTAAAAGATVGSALLAGGILPGTLPKEAAAAPAQAAIAPTRPSHAPAEVAGELKPRAAIPSILAAMDLYPLVALGERHLLQEMHDLYAALLHHPALPGKIHDVVVEFGNARYQDVADRFVLGDQPVARSELEQVWRFTIGGRIYWDAPVYEQFFRTVRAINWMLPPARRIRVLLGDPPFDHRKVRGAADVGYALAVDRQRDAHYAAVVEREVLRKGRRALLIAGSNHLLRDVHDQSTPPGPNAATRLVQRHPGALYVIDLLVLPPGTSPQPLVRRAQATVVRWPRPSVAELRGTWLGATTQSAEPWINSAAYLANTPASVRYGAQADAVLYLGPGEALTASQADPALYHWGSYPAELQRLSTIFTQGGQPTDLVAEGLDRTQAGPSWFNQFGPPTK